MKHPDFTTAELMAVELSLMDAISTLNSQLRLSDSDDPENNLRLQRLNRTQQALFKIRYTHDT